MDVNDCGTAEPDVSIEEEEDLRETVKLQAISECPQHLPLYVSLAEYSLQTPQTFPLDSSLLPQEAPDRDEPIRTTSAGPQPPNHRGPTDVAKGHHVSSQSSPPSSSTSNAGSRLESCSYTSHIPLLSSMTPVTNLPTVASYQSTVSRESQSSHRPPPRLHEIQPPSRRLSTHQMLLLTPFGGQLPATALTTPGGPLGMSRVSSNASIPEGVAVSAGFLERSSIGSSVSMKGSRSNRGSLMEVSSSSMGLGIGIGTGALDMSKNLSSTPMSHLPTRSCQPISAGSGVINSSPLVSAPTSSQALVSRPGDQRDLKRERTQPPRSTTGVTHGPRAADKSANNHEVDGRLQLMPATVAMTRCNSLPVLTLRELEAIQEKDGDLGIQRGGHWAWVSREVTVDENGNEVIESVPQGTICTGSTTVVAPLRPSFTMFQDPFAGRPPSPSAQPYIPIATSSNYRYPPAHPSRRMSEMPSVASDVSSRGMNTDTRRPSMPVVLEVGRGSKGMPHPQSRRSHLYSTTPLSSTLTQYQATRAFSR
ncbi:hypothetical protein I305_04808 [Cryptococcus gattii E566]|uniref:Uncharacterized protein n=2 Tax=Cryptococcus gattii TaxID=37769 RepID=E6RG34_CRYGW|nr:Hypothetical protein CGB_N2090W [Cryptococcus gattii WM276]ADV25744.1 Hypothetical protein CGB_N2090W [Cryptococcus gattii WM276]KIR78030.1 hypothetical protein I306_04905 [Cryptococcus gattii EJB2]KIY32651.1 hypothetical protein I305_04808 [Cryptococcus gattii E566]KJD99680.1 hypothetical protein I311_06724 [Cryptococcus gattii NT-10]